MLRLAVEARRVAPLTLAQVLRLVAGFLGAEPLLDEFRRDVEEDALAKLLDRRQPFDVAGKVGAVDGELDLVELTFGRRRRRLQAGEAI